MDNKRLVENVERMLGDGAVLFGGVLLLDGLKARFVHENGGDILETNSERWFGELSVVNERWAPSISSEIFPGDEDGAGGDHRRKVLEHRILLKHALAHVGSEPDHAPVGVSSLEVSHEEAVGAGDGHVVVELFDHFLLHDQDLVLGVGPVRYVHEFLELWRVDFLVL